MKFVNCFPGEPLGYPGYYRAVYVVSRLDPYRFLPVLQRLVMGLEYAGVVSPLNEPAPAPGDRAAVLDFAVTNEDAGRVTVAELARKLDLAPFWGIWPAFLTAVSLESLERISSSDAYSEASRDQARQHENTAANNDVYAQVKQLLLVLVVVAVVVAAIYAAGRAARLVKAVRQ